MIEMKLKWGSSSRDVKIVFYDRKILPQFDNFKPRVYMANQYKHLNLISFILSFFIKISRY